MTRESFSPYQAMSSLDILRNSSNPQLIVYDVLGHFPRPRDQISFLLAQSFNLRSRNGLLFSKEGDLVVASHSFDESHLAWLRECGWARGRLYCYPKFDLNRKESFLEVLLKSPLDLEELSSEMSLKTKTIFTWMNTANERALADHLKLSLCWNTPVHILESQFSKASFKTFLVSREVPTPDGFVWDLPTQVLSNLESEFLSRLESLSSSLIFVAKPDSAAAGVGIFRFSISDYKDALSKMCRTNISRWVIESYCEFSISLNVQLFISDSEIFNIGSSEQILNEFMYAGNKWNPGQAETPQFQEAMRQARVIANALYHEGYRGLVGLDFLLLPGGKVYCIENNIRINGSTFSLILISFLESLFRVPLFWRFMKFSLTEPKPFCEVKSAMGDHLFCANQSWPNGVFIQEFFVDNEGTHISATLFSDTEVGLEHQIESIVRMVRGANEQ